MSLSITALVIGGSSDSLEETLFGLDGQTRKADRVLVGCTDVSEKEIAKKFNYPYISVSGSFVEKLQALFAAVEKSDWYWILFSDSCPDPSALEKLGKTAETSPSASMVAPKLVKWEHPNQFVSFGKTLTQLGSSFELVDAEIDQGQHDLLRDVLSADFAGGLIREDALNSLGSTESPMASRSTIFGIKQWLTGSRVLLEPGAKVRLGPSHGIDGERNRLGEYFATRFSDYHLSLVTLPRVLAFAIWLLLPLTTVLRSVWLIGSRKVRYFFPELLAGFAAFFSVPSHLRGASDVRRSGKLQSLKALRAERSKIRDRARRGFSELPPAEYRPGLLSGPWAWLIPLTLVLNYRLLPTAEAAVGGNLLPLNANWFELATNGWRLVEGYPIDSLIFPLSLITFAGFWSPSNALAIFNFIAPAIAFSGAWLALSRLSEKRLPVSLLALAFAVSPISAMQLVAPDISSIIAFAFIGLFIHGLIMIVQSSVSSRAWRWTAWSALMMAVVSSAVPYLLPLLLLLVVMTGVFNLKRLGFIGFVPILSIILVWPNMTSWIANPQTLFAPLGGETSYDSDWILNLTLFVPLTLLFLAAVVTVVVSPNLLSVVLLFGSALSVLGFAAVENLQFIRTPGYSEPTHAIGWPLLLLGVFALLVTLARSEKRMVSIISSFVSLGVFATGGFLQLTQESQLSWAEYRQVPAIVEVESQRFELNTLMISEAGDVVYLRPGNGENLGEQSVLADLLANQDREQQTQIATLGASMIASNSVGISETMNQFSIAFVQLQGNNPLLSSQLSRLPELTFAGQTADGALWRVDGTELNDKRILILPEQLIPWAAILAALLFSIPTPAAIRGRARIRGRK